MKPAGTPVEAGTVASQLTRVAAKFGAGIAHYEPTDGPDLVAFQRRTFGEGSRQLDAARTTWLFDRNPCAAPGSRGMWICRRQGAVVGQQAEIPFDLQVGDEMHRAAWAVDLMVEDAWRLHGIGPGLVATMLQKRPIVATMNMSEKGAALVVGQGWTDLGVVPVYVRPLVPSRAAGLASAGRAGPARRAAGSVLRPFDPLVRAVDATVVGGVCLAGARLEPVERLDARTDEVWHRARADYRVLARRDLARLAWLLEQRPDRDRLLRYYLRRRGSTLGYVVLRLAGRAASTTAVVVDYLAPSRWVAPLLLAAGVEARRRGALALSVKSRNQPADRALRAAGFLRRQGAADAPIRFALHCTGASEVCAQVTDPDAWFVTSADCDLEYGVE